VSNTVTVRPGFLPNILKANRRFCRSASIPTPHVLSAG
jgi:hypothetical protein